MKTRAITFILLARTLVGPVLGTYTTSVDIADKNIPSGFSLSQNYPNPFNPTTTIKFSIPSVGRNSISTNKVLLKVYDLLGREITTLVNEEKSSGNYEVKFNAETFHGTSLPSGVYVYSLRANRFFQSKKMLLMK